MQKICIIGLGYIGLPTALVAAHNDFEVVGFDIDENRVNRINTFDPVIQEPEITVQLREVLATKKFKATTHIEAADCFVIAVPTPFKDQRKADLSFVWQAADAISTVLKKNDVIILESTVPVGATDELARRLADRTTLQAGIDFFVAHCPERVLPGNIFFELVHNARIIGGINEKSMQQATRFYKKFVKGSLYLTNATTAEMIKLVENSSRDVAIAFANQVAAMAYKVGLDPFEVIELANKHPRVSILNPSCGVGGHCIAVDPWFLIETFPGQTQLLQAARTINDEKPLQVVQVAKRCIQQWRQYNNRPCTVLILGLTYKPNIDDIRESPAIHIAQELLQDNAINLLVCEPNLPDEAIKKAIGIAGSPLERAIEQTDIILGLVNHKQFNSIDRTIMHYKKVLDFCGIWHKPRAHSQEQEFLFWPAYNATIESIVEYVQGEK